MSSPGCNVRATKESLSRFLTCPAIATTLIAAIIILPAPSFADVQYMLERPVVTVSFDYREKDESRSGPSVPPRSEQTDTFWQHLELRSRGWVYHPDLLLFDFGIEPQWKQQDTVATDSFDRSDDDRFFGYFVNAQILRSKLHSFQLFLRQSRNEFDSSLSPDNVTETDVSRFIWRFDNNLLPTTVTLESNDTLFEDFFSVQDNSDILRLESRYVSKKHQFNLLSEYVDQFRQIDVQDIDVDRFLVSANSNYQFSDRARLTSTIFDLDSRSDISDTNSFFWSERLMLSHRTNLRSDYVARFDSRKNDSFRSDVRYLSAGVEHQMYENLTTRFEIYNSHDDFSDGKIDISEADLDFRYVRKIPPGVLSITNGYAYRVEDNNIQAATSQVLGESLTLTDTTAEILARRNIDIGTIVVTDATRTTTFVAGVDYFLTVIGDSVTIERSIFGGITDGQLVLVDYVFTTQAPFESDRFAYRFGVNLNLWSMLRLYYNYDRTEEGLISGTNPNDLSDDRVHRVGMSLRWRFSTTTADYEDRDTVRTPLTRRHFQQALRFRLTRSFSFGVSANYTETRFKEDGSDSQTIGYGGNLRWNMGRWGMLELDAFLRDIDGRSQDTRSEGFVSKWSVRYGAWSGFVRFESLDDEDTITTQARDRNLLTLHVSRIFR